MAPQIFNASGTMRVSAPSTFNVQCSWHYHKVHCAVFFICSSGSWTTSLDRLPVHPRMKLELPSLLWRFHFVSMFPQGMELMVAKQVTMSPDGNWAESSSTIGVYDGVAHCLMLACLLHCNCCKFTSVLSWKEFIFCTTLAVSCWLADM